MKLLFISIFGLIILGHSALAQEVLPSNINVLHGRSGALKGSPGEVPVPHQKKFTKGGRILVNRKDLYGNPLPFTGTILEDSDTPLVKWDKFKVAIQLSASEGKLVHKKIECMGSVCGGHYGVYVEETRWGSQTNFEYMGIKVHEVFEDGTVSVHLAKHRNFNLKNLFFVRIRQLSEVQAMSYEEARYLYVRE
jgi:hypothetical protein